MQKIEVVVNPEFTRAFREHVHHCTRITVTARGGRQYVGEWGGAIGDLSDPLSDAQIEDKFRALTEDSLGVEKCGSILEMLWNLENMEEVAGIAPHFVMAS